MLFYLISLILCNIPDNYGVEYDSSEFKTLLLTPSSLKEYTVPSSCTTINGGQIETSSFRPCRNTIQKISFQEGSQLTTISNYVFYGSTIKTLDFGNCNELKTIPSYLCASCLQLSELILPPNIDKINNCAFQQCYKLMYIKFPSSLTSLGLYAFQYTDYNFRTNFTCIWCRPIS